MTGGYIILVILIGPPLKQCTILLSCLCQLYLHMLRTYFSVLFHVNCVLQGHVDKTKEIGLNNKNVINIDTETVVLTQGKFPIYNDSFLDEFPPVWLFAAVDLAFSLAGVSLGGAPFLS